MKRVFSTLQLVAVFVTAVLALTAVPAAAVPQVGKFGRAIDALGGYDGARRCDPNPKPGVLSFRSIVLAAYPGTGAGGISRPCYGGAASSEHNEGRAWDWGVNAGVPSQKRQADSLIAWLIKEDRYGNEAAMARRFGIMYIIWNRRIWFPWGGWETYCRQRPAGCMDPDGGGVRSPHTDHVHFSFSRRGASKQTTFWNKDRSMISAIEPQRGGNGYWLMGRNGSVLANNAYYLGSKEQQFPEKPFISIAALPASNGYWMLNSRGAVSAAGEARRRGDISDKKARAVDIEATPTGVGYWILSGGGRVFAFGNAGYFGAAGSRDVDVVAMTVTPSGQGYWLLTRGGNVLSFGDATDHGGLEPGGRAAVDIAATTTGGGYWVVTDNGRVRAFGDAPHLGDGSGSVVGIAPTPTGRGYRLVTELGNVRNFGDAR